MPTKDPSPEAVAKALAQALCRLAQLNPKLSAARPAGRVFASLLAGACILAVLAAGLKLNIGAFAWVFMGLSAVLTGFRLWACSSPERPTPQAKPHDPTPEEPIWTILVALYQEAGSVGSLLEALERLDWPKDKLDLVFACEADDQATLAALRQRATRCPFRIIQIPAGGPRTKPKALQTALPFCRGHYLTVYDAEDIPTADQIRQAWGAFRQGPHTLAVVQAPLVIWNDRESWITQQFALDYAIWFRLILPALMRLSRFLPLGGTSNHFDIEHLRAAGGWDPYNVTEDADLGVRLARRGLTATLIASPTYEEGAPTLDGWIRQRGRWIQGHIQTISVHLRTPIQLTHQLGGRSLCAFFLGLSSGPLSAALMLVSILLATHQAFNGEGSHILIWSSAMGLSQVLISIVAAQRDGRKSLWIACLTFPLYHACHGPALCRAIWRIYLSPSIWDKTKHGAEARPRLSSSAMGQHAISEPQTWIGQQL